MKHFIITIFFAFLFQINASAQISLDSSDVGSAGDNVVYSLDPTNANVGTVGASQTWDFTGLSAGQTKSVVHFFNANQIPGHSQFPGANLALSDEGLVQFWSKSNTSLTLNGFMLSFAGFIDSLPIALNPALKILDFPADYGDSLQTYTSTSVTIPFDTAIPNPLDTTQTLDIDSVRGNVGVTLTSKINGWGDLQMPGATLNALRHEFTQKLNITVEVYTVLPFFGGTWVQIPTSMLPDIPSANFVFFWGKGYQYPLVEVTIDSLGQGQGARFQPQNSSSIPNLLAKPEVLYLYPNPAGKTVSIRFAPSIKTLRLLNLLGKELQSKNVSGMAEKELNLDLSDYKSGVYLIEARSERERYVRKLIIE